ncbi:hypothetical protein OJAV_G00119390 [Oryzias javanicus]|uniref:Uncharacterized protein n=1 Tax=Oryzias javanicus TaxID=123683 RepID=A0A437CUY6_ORYJA|nr:hypothetical protein OJAV_G00119390 [Oryzias javanicus]
MRFLCVLIAATAFHSALSASFQSASNVEITTPYDGLTELQKIDQMEFEAAQKAEEGQMNVTEGRDEDAENTTEEHVEAENDSTVHPNCDAVSPAEGAGSNADSSREESSSCEDAVDHPEVVTEMANLGEPTQTVPEQEDVLE